VLFDAPNPCDVLGDNARRPSFLFGVVDGEPKMDDAIPDNYVRRPNPEPLFSLEPLLPHQLGEQLGADSAVVAGSSACRSSAMASLSVSSASPPTPAPGGVISILRLHVDFDVDVASRIFGKDLSKLPNSTSMTQTAKQLGPPLLNHRQQQHHLRGDDRERTASARQAAEALFTPKPAEPVSDPVPSAERPARKPRVLSILSPPPVRNEQVAAPVDPEPPTTRHVPRSEHARIRTLVEYGMSVPQVARVYGVAVDGRGHPSASLTCGFSLKAGPKATQPAVNHIVFRMNESET
jgi:hypothetical protein